MDISSSEQGDTLITSDFCNEPSQSTDTNQQESVIVLPGKILRGFLADVERYSDDVLQISVLCDSKTQGRLKRDSLAVYSLPVELIHQIYYQLSAPDFDSARQSCHFWRLASLDRRILIVMFKRAGWWSSMLKDLESLNKSVDGSKVAVNESWYLSQRLSRECSLLPHWNSTYVGDTRKKLKDGQISISLARVTDLRELSCCHKGYSSSKKVCNLHFNASACGQYILISESFMIYVYKLSTDGLRPCCSIPSPKRVLATSMDTSGGRYAVAALLDGRMGLVCDIEFDLIHSEKQTWPQHRHLTQDTTLKTFHPASTKGYSHSMCSNTKSGSVDGIDIHSTDQLTSIDHPMQESEQSGINQDWHDELLPFRHAPRRSPHNWRSSEATAVAASPHNQVAESAPQLASPSSISDVFQIHDSIPLSPASLAIYHNICTPNDPPRSIAICPSYKCVAFGCRTGVELHWMDCRGGRNLMKWFPLSAPSDLLHFIPRNVINLEPRKLRIISSQAGPGQKNHLVDVYNQRRRANNSQYSSSMLRAGLIDSESISEPMNGRPDHYASVPISDGFHLLFTDPTTGDLHLGGYASTNNSMKITRKIQFIPPDSIVGHYRQPRKLTSRLYAAAYDLSWGIRVVAIYGDAVVFYTVPLDVLDDICRIDGAAIINENSSDDLQLGEWSHWWRDRSPGPPSRPSWPLVVRGAFIAEIPCIVDVAVQGSPELTIWTFGNDGLVRTFQIRYDRSVKNMYVDSSGIVIPQEIEWCSPSPPISMDQDGDMIMIDEQMSNGTASFRDSSKLGACDQMDGARDDMNVKVYAEPPWSVKAIESWLSGLCDG